MSNILTRLNQIPTTKIVLIEYQKSLCVASKKEEPEIARMLRKKILIMFKIKNRKNETNKIFSLLFRFIFAVEKFRIKRR